MEHNDLESVVFGQDPYLSKSCEDVYVPLLGEQLGHFQPEKR